MKRLEALAGSGDRGSGLTDDVAVGLIVALAHPDRIARRRRSSGSYLLASGTGAALDPRDPGPLAGLEWPAVADADRRPGSREARMRPAAPPPTALALTSPASLWTAQARGGWAPGRGRG